MGYVPYVGFAAYRRATVKICLYVCIKKKGSSQAHLAVPNPQDNNE
jgi:hypothetical protein